MDERIFTIYEVADILGLHHKTIRGFIANGKLKAIKVGKQWRIAKEDLDAFMGKEDTKIELEGKRITIKEEDTTEDGGSNTVSISTVIDIKAVDREKFERVSNSLLAVMNSEDELFKHATIHMNYNEKSRQFKILLWGGFDYIKEMLSMTKLLIEGEE